MHNKLKIVGQERLEEPLYKNSENTIYYPLGHSQELALFIQSYSFDNLEILSQALIDEVVLQALKDNQHLVFVKLGCSAEPYTLTRRVFDILNASESLMVITTDEVDGEYTISEMGHLTYFNKIVVGSYKISDFFVNYSFAFYQSLSFEEIKMLARYIKPQSNIRFLNTDYDNIFVAIEALKGRNIVFDIPYTSKLTAYYPKLQEFFQSGEVIYAQDKRDLKKEMQINTLLDVCLHDILQSDLSIFEKYLAVFQIVTHFKPYRENNDDKKSAREIEYILFNEYMVCRGYVELARAMLKKLGINAKDMLIALKEGENITYHARLIVRLDDDKYDIHGIYVADPTWDSTMTQYYFNYAALNFYEMKLESDEFVWNDYGIFTVNTAEEFLEYIQKYPLALPTFLETVEVVDFDFYEYLRKNYDLDIHDRGLQIDVYDYIIKNTKRRIPVDTRVKAIKELIRFIYPYTNKEDREVILNKIEEENKVRDDVYFKRGRE